MDYKIDSRKCAKQSVTAVIVNKGNFWVGSNWCENPQEICPRKDMPSGVGYELCKDICKQKYHAEVDVCMKAGENARGGTLYLMGHTYCCDDCKKVMSEHGIEKIVIGELGMEQGIKNAKDLGRIVEMRCLK